MDSFREWLKEFLNKRFDASNYGNSMIIWCDPDSNWKDILEIISEDSFELWADTDNELILRHRLHSSSPNRRVIYVPRKFDDLSFLRVYADSAIDIIEIDQLEALLLYGAPIPSEKQAEIKPNLAGYIKSWLDEPKSKWNEIYSGDDRVLITPDMILQVLSIQDFKQLEQSDKFEIFSRIVTDDYGLPDPRILQIDEWRLKSVIRMITSEAYSYNEKNPPNNPSNIEYDSKKRDNLLKLLDNWKKRTDYYPHFEQLMKIADEQAQLRFWADGLSISKQSYSSRVVETKIFENELELLAKLVPIELCQELRRKKDAYDSHAGSFWGKTASFKVDWKVLADYAYSADALVRNEGVEGKWSSISEAVSWYINQGWIVDMQSEYIHQEYPNLPGALHGIRAKLRRVHYRIMDKTNQMFSVMIVRQGLNRIELDYPGQVSEKHVEEKDRMAFVIADAMRYELGKRIEKRINEGESVKRAQVIASRSSIPSITPLGMAHSLPGAYNIESRLNKSKKGIQVLEKSLGKDVSDKSGRINWLKEKYDLTDSSFVSIDELLDSDIKSKRLGKMLFVFGQDFDEEGHIGRLKLTGAENLVERYSVVARKLRSIGYSKIIMVTDHGYYNWDSNDYEIEEKPEGEVYISSRRYTIGRDLKHSQSLTLEVSGSNIECLIPRSINVYKAYGGIGFYHGGTTLQEYIIPVVVIEWPEKAKKVAVHLAPISEITSLNQRVEVEPSKVQKNLYGSLDETVISRRIIVKVEDPTNRRVLFRSLKDHIVEPGGEKIVVELERIEGETAGFNSVLNMLVCDSDNEEILSETKVTLKVEMDDWF